MHGPIFSNHLIVGVYADEFNSCEASQVFAVNRIIFHPHLQLHTPLRHSGEAHSMLLPSYHLANSFHSGGDFFYIIIITRHQWVIGIIMS